MTAQTTEPASKIEIPDSVAGGEIPSFDVTLRIRRYSPEVSDESAWEDFRLPMYGSDRVLDALHKVKWEQDGSLSFCRSCAHGVCGSDAMRINGMNRLACKVLLKDLNLDKPITIAPLQGLPVEKDLIVDMESFSSLTARSCRFLSAGAMNRHVSICSPSRNVSVSTTRPNASSAPPAPAFVWSSGPTGCTLALPLL